MDKTLDLPLQGGKVYLTPDNAGEVYVVETGSPTEWMLIIFGSSEPVAGMDNAIRCVEREYEFKHYLPGGGKSWTKENGFDYPFAVHKRDLRVLDKTTYSYPVLVLPGGERIRMNTSGGSYTDKASGQHGWCDYLCDVASSCINHPIETWRALNAIAVKSGTPFDNWKTPEEREAEFYQKHGNDLIVCSAWGDWQNGVPKGMVLVLARPGGHRSQGRAGERWFLVDARKYENCNDCGYVITDEPETELRA